MTKHLSRDLDQLKKTLLEVGGLVEDAIQHATVALLERRVELAHEVIAGDSEIDRREVVIEEECLKILALHQPVAADLRFLVSVLKVNNDLERMGDLAKNIAQRAVSLAEAPPLPMPGNFRRMVDEVQQMVRDSLGALVAVDAVRARKVLKADDDVDRMHSQTFDEMQVLMGEGSEHIARALSIITVSRNLERIADQATNIAEDVIFLVEGEIIRHNR